MGFVSLLGVTRETSIRSSMPLSPSVYLRPILPPDLPILFQFQLDPESNTLAAVNPRDLPTFNALWAKTLADPTATARAIIADDGQGEPCLVGSIGCFKQEGTDSVGYLIARPHWNKGYATRALTLLLEEVTIRPLHARAARANAPSIRVLEKCGFVVTGYRHSPGTDRYLACEEAELVLA